MGYKTKKVRSKSREYTCMDNYKTYSPIIRKLRDRGVFNIFTNVISSLSREHRSDAAICRELTRRFGSFFPGTELQVSTYRKWKDEEPEIFIASLGDDCVDAEVIKKKYIKMAKECSDIDDFCKLLKFFDKVYMNNKDDNNKPDDGEGSTLIEDIMKSLEYLSGDTVGDNSDI